MLILKQVATCPDFRELLYGLIQEVNGVASLVKSGL